MIDKTFLGGGQINLLSLAKSIDQSKFEISVCSHKAGALVDEIKKEGIRHFPVSFQRKKWRKTISDISSILKHNSIHILHTHGGVAGLYGRWSAHQNRTPVIVHTVHGIHYLHYRNPVCKYLGILSEKYLSRFTDVLICVSDGDRRKAQKYGLASEEKVMVIKNGIDFSKFDGLKADRLEKLNIQDSRPVVGTVARLHRQKGLIYLLKAAKRISRVFPEVKFLIIGEGPLRKKLERKSRRLGLGRRVWFMGERKDVPQLLSLVDVVVLPSLWEGLPYALIEASALAKPVVATDVEGTREIIEDGKTGILVPPKNGEILAQAVISLLHHKPYARQLGNRLKKEVLPRYTLARMVEETQNLYLRLYQKKTDGNLPT